MKTKEHSERRRQGRQYLGSMAVTAVFGVIQAIMLYQKFAMANLLYLLVSVAALRLYVFGIVDLNSNSSEKRWYNLIRKWLLMAYIVVLAVVSGVFSG